MPSISGIPVHREHSRLFRQAEGRPDFAKLPSASEIVMRDTIDGTAAVLILISGHIWIEAVPSCPPELFQVLDFMKE